MLQSHPIEHAMGNRAIGAMVDVRSLGCPQGVLNRVLESRALRLGKKFAEFRSANQLATPAVKPTSLEVELATSTLF